VIKILAILMALVLGFGFITSTEIHADGSNKGVIAGKVVVGSESCGYRGASLVVAASNISGQIVGQVASREKGAFRIGNLKPGSYRILPVGFIGASATVTVDAGKVTNVGQIKADNGSSCVDIDKKIATAVAEAIKNIHTGLTEAQVRAIVTSMTGDFAKMSDIPDVSGFATNDQVNNLGSRIDALEAWKGESSFVTQESLDQTLQGYATSADLMNGLHWLCEVDLMLWSAVQWDPGYTCDNFLTSPSAPQSPNPSSN